MKRIIEYMKTAFFVLLYIGIFFACQKLMSALIELAYSQPAMPRILDKLLVEYNLWVPLFFVTPLLISMLVLKFRKINFITFCRFRKMTIKDTIIVCLIGLATALFTSHFINLSIIIKELPEFQKYVEDVVKGNVVTIILFSGILLPLCEEIMFRGLIFNELRKQLPLVAVLFIHTLLYMPFQPNVQVSLFAFVNFTLYALVYIFTGSLWSCILVEVIGALALFTLRLSGATYVFKSWGDLYLSIAMTAALIIVIVLTIKLKKQPLKQIFAREKDEKNNRQPVT